MTQAQPPTGVEVPFGQQVPQPPEQRMPVAPLTHDAWSAPDAAWRSGQPPVWLPQPSPVRRRRPWLFGVVAGIAAIAVTAGGLAVLLAGSADTDGAGGMSVVIDEDFSTGTGAFQEFEEDGMVARHRDGAYEVTGEDGESVYWSSADIDRSASVDISARLDYVAGEHPGAAVGLSVEPNRSEAYFLSLSGNGAVALQRAVDDEEFILPLTMMMVDTIDGPATLRLMVVANASGTELTGWVNGEQVIEYTDKQGWNRFRGAGVMVASGPEPVTVRADDVVVKTAR
jgi:hypothetical protein